MTYLLYLVHDCPEKNEVPCPPVLLQHLGVVRLLVEEVVDADLISVLTVTVDTAVPLLETVRVPRDLVVDEVAAIVLEVEPFGGRIGGEEDAYGVRRWVHLEVPLDHLPYVKTHTTKEGLNAVAVPALDEELVEVFKGVLVLCKNNEPLVVPLTVGPHVLIDPGEQPFCLLVRT